MEVHNFSEKDSNEVVQVAETSPYNSPWNVTNRLYLRVSGVTYQDAGNYTCEVFNHVGGNISTADTVQVFCEYIVVVDIFKRQTLTSL